MRFIALAHTTRLCKGFGIQPHEIVQNFMSSDHAHFVEDQELSPLVYAEQFIEVDAYREKTSEELLSQARMILATELGKDPLLRKEIRELFKREGRISVLPTEKGMIKIDRHHTYYVGSGFPRLTTILTIYRYNIIEFQISLPQTCQGYA
jgi:transcription elongation factor SPT6